MEEVMIFLPTDIILEILSRLPLRSVGRFRTLSKLYHCLLSQPSFIKNHSSPQLLVNIWESQEERTCNFYYPMDDNITSSGASQIYYSSHETIDLKLVTNSCNGLFCVKDKKDRLALWNPTTRKTTYLPELPNKERHQFSFGYDSLNQDYKIVGVILLHNEGRVETNTFMYSHKRGCWKKIESSPPYCILFSHGNDQFVHGKTHWIAYSSPQEDGNIQSFYIVSLDLADERYGTIPLPANYAYHSNSREVLNVCVLGGELCLNINGYGRGFEIWMMREYGVEQSWFQLLTIPFHNLQCSLCIPFFLMKTGEILLRVTEKYGASIYLYNPKTCNFITVQNLSPRHSSDNPLFGQIYVESLVETAISYKGQSFLA